MDKNCASILKTFDSFIYTHKMKELFINADQFLENTYYKINYFPCLLEYFISIKDLLFITTTHISIFKKYLRHHNYPKLDEKLFVNISRYGNVDILTYIFDNQMHQHNFVKKDYYIILKNMCMYNNAKVVKWWLHVIFKKLRKFDFDKGNKILSATINANMVDNATIIYKLYLVHNRHVSGIDYWSIDHSDFYTQKTKQFVKCVASNTELNYELQI